MSVAYWAGPPRSYTSGRAGYGVQVIVVHSTEGSEGPTSAEDGIAYDKVRLDGTSTHVFADSNTVAREVWDQDQAHAARTRGNRIGLQLEFCGRAGQTRAQWLDAVSYPMLQLGAKMCAEWCRAHSIPVKRLSKDQLRAAYYNSPGSRPKGIVSHADVTAAFPEDGGTHTDPGSGFPWDVFFTLINQELSGGNMARLLQIMEKVDDVPAAALYGTGGSGFFHILDMDDAQKFCAEWGLDVNHPTPVQTRLNAQERFGPYLGNSSQLAAGPAGKPGAGFGPGQTVTVTGTATVQQS